MLRALQARQQVTSPSSETTGYEPFERDLQDQGEAVAFTEMCSGSEEGSYVRLIDLCITHLEARE